jgi:hypothetical protein
MSERSIRRQARRREERRSRRGRRAKRVVLSTGVALGLGSIGANAEAAAPIEVTNTSDYDAGSLRQAITDAALNGPGLDTITFAPGIGDQIVLESSLLIQSPVDIEGPGAGELTVDADGNNNVFRMYDMPAYDLPVTISGLTITGGDATSDGGGIFSTGIAGPAPELTVADSVVTGNHTDDDGGGIYTNKGSLTLIDSTVSANTSSGGVEQPDGGGIAVFDTDGDQETEVSIQRSRITGNTTTHSGGGLLLLYPGAGISITGTTISGNHSLTGSGGGVEAYFTTDSGTFELDSSTVSGNSADNGGGGLALTGARQPTVIRDSTISGNTANRGGGIDDAPYPAPTYIESSTVSGNTATLPNGGGGIFRDQDGGMDLGDLTVRSSIVAGNKVGGAAQDLGQEPASLIGTTAGGAPLTQSPAGSNRLNVAAQLGPLADNGGPTLTLLPATTSPAIDAGIANGLTTDQRGLERTIDGDPANFAGSDGTDIGAVERDIVVDGALIKAKKTQKQKGKKIVVKVKVGAAEAATAMAKGKIGKAKLKPASKPIAAGETTVLKLKPKGKKTSKKLAKALDKGKKLKAKLSVTITDGAGNTETKRPKVKLK